MKGSGDQAEGDNKASNNPQPAPRPKILRLRLPVGRKKSGSGGPSQGPRSGRSVLRTMDLEPPITWKTNAGPLQTVFSFGVNTTRSSRQ
jgi:hypothetical protein